MKLLKKILFTVIIICGFGAIVNFIIKKRVLKDYTVNPDKEILVFGDSHAECSFYDKHNVIQNFGVRSEIPNLTYLKASYLLRHELNKKIILTISPHNISEWRKKQFLEKDSTGAALSKYWSIINSQFLFNNYNKLPFKAQLTLHIKKLFGAPNVESNFKYKERFKGGFYKGKDTSIIDIEEAKIAHFRHFGNDSNIDGIKKSTKLMGYYDNLIRFFFSRKSEVIIIGTPLHYNYKSLMLPEQIKNYKDYLIQLKLKYPSIRVLDYSDLQLKDTYYLNSDHLNFEGAKVFTKIVLKDINKL